MNKVRALVVKPSGVCELATVGTDNMLSELQKLVGGYIEGLNFGENARAYVNEEGKLEGLPYNQLATALCHIYNVGLIDDVIVGNLVILGMLDENGHHDGEEHDVPTSVVYDIYRKFPLSFRGKPE